MSTPTAHNRRYSRGTAVIASARDRRIARQLLAEAFGPLVEVEPNAGCDLCGDRQPHGHTDEEWGWADAAGYAGEDMVEDCADDVAGDALTPAEYAVLDEAQAEAGCTCGWAEWASERDEALYAPYADEDFLTAHARDTSASDAEVAETTAAMREVVQRSFMAAADLPIPDDEDHCQTEYLEAS